MNTVQAIEASLEGARDKSAWAIHGMKFSGIAEDRHLNAITTYIELLEKKVETLAAAVDAKDGAA